MSKTTKDGESTKDWLSPTEIKDNSHAIERAALSDEELKAQIDRYANVSKNMEQIFGVLRLKKDYEKEMAEKNEIRNKAFVHYAQGLKAGIQHPSYESVQYNHEQEDQEKRDMIASEAKAIYSKGDNLSKEFEKSKDAKEDRYK